MILSRFTATPTCFSRKSRISYSKAPSFTSSFLYTIFLCCLSRNHHKSEYHTEESSGLHISSFYYYDIFCRQLKGKLEPTTSGHGSIDLIVPGCHKASGLKRLVQRWGITPEQCAAFGDGGNDIEMLRYCGHSYAMYNAPEDVKNAARSVCPSNEDDGVLVTLEKLFP